MTAPTTLIIARHGNTFGPADTPTRVGARTDLPLVESGQVQARKMGAYLKQNNLLPDIVYTSQLQRTQQTAQLALLEATHEVSLQPLDMLNEIDYGPDENKTEAEVIARIGADAIAAWDANGIVPKGWLADPAAITQNWRALAETCITQHAGQKILVVTSNGIARFAPKAFGVSVPTLKLSTGALGVFTHTQETGWTAQGWNIRP